MRSRLIVAIVTAGAMAVTAPARLAAQVVQDQAAPPPGRVPVPAARVTFKDAVDQATQRNPSVQQAAAEILRAQGLLLQARSAALPGITGNAVTLAQRHVVFDGQSVTPAGQVTATAALAAPLFAPALWAQTVQAQDVVRVQQVNTADVRRQVGVATAQAYLSIIARRRVFEADVRARDTAKAHYDLAHAQLAAGAGSLLNELRAQQSLSADELLVEEASLDVYRAQEALGVLVGVEGPLDTSDDPVLQVPMTLQAAEAAMPDARTDVRLAAARQAAASRVWKDSWKDWLPTASGLVQPQYLQPSTFFSPSASWRAQVAVSVPLFDAGFRRALRTEREAVFNESQMQHEAVLRQARSDVRTADESVKSAERSLADARAAADQARHVLDIVNVSFKAGAATEIEVIDAQRALLDAETSVAVTEDLLRQGRLALLVALGQFPT
jgi:outer membrane protein TolC